mgnify:CR=1 FL=1|tara:strand:- start:1766 stop:2365 length:600 start_codon:yes stop_codon:yes gene_type:complete
MNQLDYDNEYYNLSYDELWVYNKLQLSNVLGYNCGPVGVNVKRPGIYIVRPAINFVGLGLGAQFIHIDKLTDHLPPGHFWCEIFEGDHYSVDFEYGRIVRVTQGIHGNDITRWDKWITVKKDFAFPYVLWQFKDKPNVNCEFIGNKLIEAHIRKNPDFCYNNNIFIPVWKGEQINPPDGYRYIECPDVNGRIGAYVDIT